MKIIAALFSLCLFISASGQTDSLSQKGEQQILSPASTLLNQGDINAPKKLEMKNKRANALLISGSILIGTSPFAFAAGSIIAFGNAGEGGAPFKFGIVLGTFSFIELGVGLPILIAGIIMKHNYLKLSKTVNLQTGFLSTGRIGLALNF